MRFSKTIGCFYPDDIKYPELPDDLIEVTEEDFNAAMNKATRESLDVVDGKLVIIPAAPSPYHRWDTTKSTWAITKDGAAKQQADQAQALRQKITVQVQARLDGFAQTRGYDSVLSACTYATSTVPKFRSEGQCCVNLRDATWSAAYGIISDVLDGKRPMPTDITDIEADLPALMFTDS